MKERSSAQLAELKLTILQDQCQAFLQRQNPRQEGLTDLRHKFQTRGRRLKVVWPGLGWTAGRGTSLSGNDVRAPHTPIGLATGTSIAPMYSTFSLAMLGVLYGHRASFRGRELLLPL